MGYAKFDSTHSRLHCVSIRKKNQKNQSIKTPPKQAKCLPKLIKSYHNCYQILSYLRVNLAIPIQIQGKW